MTPEIPDTDEVIRLVLGIARLGEIDLRRWWNGHALDRTGQYVLSSMFRRTWRPAALQLDVSAATRMHDELLGRSTALHVFSDGLPFRRWATGWLGEQKTTEGVADLLTALETWSADQATNTLRGWCGGIDSPQGESLGQRLAPRAAIERRSRGPWGAPANRPPALRLLPRPDRRAAAAVLRPRALTAFTSNIQKGGALLDDARRVVEVWDLDHDAAWNLAYISDENLLAKASRAQDT